MDFFLAGTLVGIVVSNVWNAWIGRAPRKPPPSEDEPRQLPPPRRKRRS